VPEHIEVQYWGKSGAMIGASPCHGEGPAAAFLAAISKSCKKDLPHCPEIWLWVGQISTYRDFHAATNFNNAKRLLTSYVSHHICSTLQK